MDAPNRVDGRDKPGHDGLGAIRLTCDLAAGCCRTLGRALASSCGEGPQHVTVHGRDEVVVISAEEFRRLKGDLTDEALIARCRPRRIAISTLNRGARRCRCAVSPCDGLAPRHERPVGAAPSEAGTQSPAEFLALQVSRLNEALLVAYGAMSAENLEAVDRVVKIVRELDRYHGFAVQAARRDRPVSRRPRLPLSRSRRRARGRNPLAPQPIETIRFASRNGGSRRERRSQMDSGTRPSLRAKRGNPGDAARPTITGLLRRPTAPKAGGLTTDDFDLIASCSQRVDLSIARSAWAMLSGRPTCTQRPSRRTP